MFDLQDGLRADVAGLALIKFRHGIGVSGEAGEILQLAQLPGVVHLLAGVGGLGAGCTEGERQTNHRGENRFCVHRYEWVGGWIHGKKVEPGGTDPVGVKPRPPGLPNTTVGVFLAVNWTLLVNWDNCAGVSGGCMAT